MGRINFITYQGKTILFGDFTDLRPGKEFQELVDAAQKLIASRPPNSVLAMFDATNARFDMDVISRMKDFVHANTPYIHASAVVGIGGLMLVALNTLSNIRGRKFPVFATREEALEYLVKQ